jgi:Septum formation
MVAPTGVNEGLPHEPAKAGRGGAELAEPKAGAAEPGETAPAEAEAEAEEKAGPASVVPAGVVPPGVVPPQAEPAAAERTAVSAEAGPEVSGLAEAEPELGGAEPAEAGLAGAGLAGAEPVEAEPVEAEPVEAEPVEAGGADWDAEESRRKVSPLAVAGFILGVIALVGVAVGVLAVVTHGFRPKTVVTYRAAAVFGLRPGQCVNSGSDTLKFTALSCARPHDAEVFAAFSLPATAWPGASAVQVDAGDGCANRFDSYIDPQLAAAGLTQEYVYPNQAAWQAGERTVVCEVSAVSGQLTGSVRAKG